MERIEITVHGRVQGVAFRWYTTRQAEVLGVTGWVRNRPDGTVQVVAEGPRDDLDTFLAWVERGPDHARVDRCDVFRSEAAGTFTDFTVKG